jgi:hypothetical protein
MATGITIQSASYGTGTTTVDVTDGVVAQNKQGNISFVVTPSALNVEDPAIGQVKTLTVNYSINDGSTNTTTAKDGETFSINAPPERVAAGLQIKKAQYGYDGNLADVTSAVQTYLNNGTLNITVSPQAVGIPDPNPTKPKFLQLDVTINEVPSSYKVPDGKKFTLSAPPAVSVRHKNQDTAWGFISMVFGKMVWCLMLTLWFCSVRISAEYGQTLFPGGYYLLGASALFTWGIFPTLILPFFIFWWSLIVG